MTGEEKVYVRMMRSVEKMGITESAGLAGVGSSAMDDQELALWIFEQAGPVLRYRIACDLLQLSHEEKESLKEAMLQTETVRYWLSLLGEGPVHHSADRAAENAIAKLVEYGLRAGIPEFDARMLPYCNEDRWGGFPPAGMILAPFLIAAGYQKQPAVEDWFKDRLAALRRTARKGSYDVHLTGVETAAVPRAWREKAVYLAEYDPVWGSTPLPTCYDLYAMSHWVPSDSEESRAIEEVVAYLADPRFQALPDAYIWRHGQHRCYAAGRVFLACSRPERMLLFLELAAPFPSAQRAPWFIENLRSLASTRTPSGTFLFPKEWLKEKAETYHLYAGGHMGLGEDRQERGWQERESTFHMLRIRTLMGRKCCQDSSERKSPDHL